MSVACEKCTEGYAILSLQRKPVNAFNFDLWKELDEKIRALETDPTIRGVIFCSGLKKDVFTAGNDLQELYAPATSLARYKKFWKMCNDCLSHLLISPLITVSAIRGQCPAGGCMLSLCCDHRLMTDFGKIGLNEVGLGIPVPKYWLQLMEKTIGHGPARTLLLTGAMISSREALGLGMIHEICRKGTLLPRAVEHMRHLLKIPIEGRIATKDLMFRSFVQSWMEENAAEAEFAFGFLSRPKNVKFLKNVIESLSGRAHL